MSQFEQYRFHSSNYMATDYLKSLASTQFAQRFQPPRKKVQDFIQQSILNNRFRYLNSIWNPPSIKQEIVYGKLVFSNGKWSIKPKHSYEPFDISTHVIDQQFFASLDTRESQPLWIIQGDYPSDEDPISKVEPGGEFFFDFEETESYGLQQVPS